MFPENLKFKKHFLKHQGTMIALAPFYLRKEKEMECLTQRIKF